MKDHAGLRRICIICFIGMLVMLIVHIQVLVMFNQRKVNIHGNDSTSDVYMAVADVYDALTSARSYKKAWTAEEAYKIITEESGTHFDPDVVEAFKKHFDDIKEVQELYRDETSTYRF